MPGHDGQDHLDTASLLPPVRRDSLTFPPHAESVTAARHFLSHTLRTWGLHVLVDRAQLAASEVLTNAVVHAGTPFVLTLHYADVLAVSVRDSVPPWPRSSARPTLAPESADTGRGLAVVEAVTDTWGVRRDGDGKIVWFHLQLPAPCPD